MPRGVEFARRHLLTWGSKIVICSDPLVEFLKAQGYCVVRVPRADLRPLQLLAKQDGALERIGDLDQALAPGEAPAPEVSVAVPLPTLSGRRTGTLSAGIGLSLLGDAFRAVGAAPPSLGVSFQPGTTMSLAFDGVTEDRVDLVSLDRYLAAADVRPGSPTVSALLDSDDVYVITTVVRCRRLLVSARRSDGGSVALAVPDLQGTVDVGGTFSVRAEGDTEVAYEGRTPVAFGFKAVRLRYQDGQYVAFKRIPPGRVMRGGRSGPEHSALEVAGPFARLR
jgi:hypothetical protein